MDAAPTEVHFREVTQANLYAVLRLAVKPEQAKLVARVGDSIAEAHYYPNAWFRAIYAGDTAVGFVLLSDERLAEGDERGEGFYLWRFLIDQKHQGKGYGRAALALIIDHCKAQGVPTLTLSYVPAPGNPEALYRSCGFIPTGEIDDGEVVMRKMLN